MDMDFKNDVEILAPAGDYECLEAAVRFGADAVYLGMSFFGMRDAAKGFEADELKKAVMYAHKHNVKVYLTVNIIPHNHHITQLPQLIETAKNADIDAFIVADLGVMAIIKELASDIPIHISTQAGVINYAAACELYKMGAKRIILARELTIDEIKEIRENIPDDLELEVFVHGAICVSFSGRCLLSNYMTGRDANLGKCAQPCRWNYKLMEEKRPGEFYPVYEDEMGTTILNAADMSMLEHLDKLKNIGVTNFKIEGRAKSMYYVSSVTSAYSQAKKQLLKDEYILPQWVKDEVYKVSNRNYTTGFFFDKNGAKGKPAENGYIRTYNFIAVITGYENGCIIASQRGKFYLGDTLEVLSPNIEPYEIKISEMYDENFSPIESTPHAKMKIYIKNEKKLPLGSILRQITNYK